MRFYLALTALLFAAILPACASLPLPPANTLTVTELSLDTEATLTAEYAGFTFGLQSNFVCEEGSGAPCSLEVCVHVLGIRHCEMVD